MESSNNNIEKKLDQVLEIVLSVQEEVLEIRRDQKQYASQNDREHEDILEGIEELKASAMAVDKILEAHPVGRINRLETHVGLPKFVVNTEVE